MAKRNHALAFACKTLSEVHRHNRLTLNAAASASGGTTIQTKLDRLFAATYKRICAIDLYGHKTFTKELPIDNSEHYLLKEQKKTAVKHIRKWKQNKNFPRIQVPNIHIPIAYYAHDLQRVPRQHEVVKRVPSASDGPRHHRCLMATVPPTPSLISILFGPTMANATVHEATQGDYETNANQGEEPSSARSTTISYDREYRGFKKEPRSY
jgi:hypothetical protein